MAQEIRLNAALSYFRAGATGQPVGMSVADMVADVSDGVYVEGTVAVQLGVYGAIPLGGVTRPHWSYFRNLSPTATILIAPAGGAPLIRLGPGEETPCALDELSAPVAMALTDVGTLEYLITSL